MLFNLKALFSEQMALFDVGDGHNRNSWRQSPADYAVNLPSHPTKSGWGCARSGFRLGTNHAGF